MTFVMRIFLTSTHIINDVSNYNLKLMNFEKTITNLNHHEYIEGSFYSIEDSCKGFSCIYDRKI
jgi:hypothetical protein